jgi:hypothetical protein
MDEGRSESFENSGSTIPSTKCIITLMGIEKYPLVSKCAKNCRAICCRLQYTAVSDDACPNSGKWTRYRFN